MSNHDEVGAPTAENDHISVTVKHKPQCIVVFDIVVKLVAVLAAYAKAKKNVSKEVNIPGFRKGKAPENMLVQKYADQIEREFIDIVLSTAFNEALQLTSIHPLREGHMQRPIVKYCDREKGAHFTIEFEAHPQVPSIHFEELELKKREPAAVTQEAQDEALHQVLLQFATFEPVTDRPAQQDDFVNLTVQLLENDQPIIADNQRVQLNGGKDLPTWLAAKVIGLGVDESAEGISEVNPDSQGDFKPVSYRVTVHSISVGKLPEVNEEFAEKFGFQTIDKLKSTIAERLHTEAKEAVYRQLTQNLDEQLLAKFAFEVPQSYVDNDSEARMKDYLSQVNVDQLPKNDLVQIREAFRKTSKHLIQLLLLKQKVIQDYQIVVDEKDVAEEFTRQIALMATGKSQITINSDSNEMRKRLENLALDRKVKEFLIGKAVLQEV